MSHILFTPYADEYSVFSAAAMNKPLEGFDEALVYMKNIIITCDGDIIANSTDGRFSFTGNLRVLFTSPIDGKLIENTVSGTVVELALGDCLYVDLNGVNGTALSLQKVNWSGGSLSVLKTNRILLAYRNNVTGEISLANTLHKIASGGGQTSERTVALADNVSVSAGQLLCLNDKGQYMLADNASIETTLDLVMVKAAAVREATVIEAGLMTKVAEFAVGVPLYLGAAGDFTLTAPTESGKIVKCVGYTVAENVIKFKPDSLGIELI